MAGRAAAILDDLKGIKRGFVLNRGGLGKGLLDIVSESVQRNIDEQRDPDGTPWEPLSEEYAASAAKRGKPMAHLWEIMTKPDEIEGQRFISREEARYVFGVTDAAKEEAGWFQEGNANQPPRRFVGLDDVGLQLCDELLDDHFGGLF